MRQLLVVVPIFLAGCGSQKIVPAKELSPEEERQMEERLQQRRQQEGEGSARQRQK